VRCLRLSWMCLSLGVSREDGRARSAAVSGKSLVRPPFFPESGLGVLTDPPGRERLGDPEAASLSHDELVLHQHTERLAHGRVQEEGPWRRRYSSLIGWSGSAASARVETPRRGGRPAAAPGILRLREHHPDEQFSLTQVVMFVFASVSASWSISAAISWSFSASSGSGVSPGSTCRSSRASAILA